MFETGTVGCVSQNSINTRDEGLPCCYWLSVVSYPAPLFSTFFPLIARQTLLVLQPQTSRLSGKQVGCSLSVELKGARLIIHL